MRRKEDANDYRYFPDPDLLPIVTSDETLETLRASIPQLPDERKGRYIQEYGLAEQDADALVNDLEVADYFEAAAAQTKDPKGLAHLITS